VITILIALPHCHREETGVIKQTAALFIESPAHKTVPERFFAALHPVILQANNQIWVDRQHLLSLQRQYENSQKLSFFDSMWLDSLANKYGLKTFELTNAKHWEMLATRVDIVPAGLALAQAATESGFGRSRFATLGNNLFGHSCFASGCGIAPRGQKAGTPYELQKFSSVQNSVELYLRNINTHRAYDFIRRARAVMRAKDTGLKAIALAEGLESYSERGHAYIRQIQTMIKRHGLENYTSL